MKPAEAIQKLRKLSRKVEKIHGSCPDFVSRADRLELFEQYHFLSDLADRIEEDQSDTKEAE